MATDTAKDMGEYIFVGQVSSYGKTPGTVIVRRPDKDDRTTDELYVMSRCTKETKDWWMPDIDDQVLCVLLPNTSGKGPGAGFVIGAFYSNVDAPAESDNNVRSIRYKDGSYIRNDGGNIEIHASGSLKLTAPRIDLN